MNIFNQQERLPSHGRQWYQLRFLTRLSLFVALLLFNQTRLFSQTFPANFSQVAVATGLSDPTIMAFTPDGRIWVAQQNGALRIIKNGNLLPNPFVELLVDPSGERGLIGIAIDPNFQSNQYIYLYYTVPAIGGTAAHNRVSRFTAVGDVALLGSETVLLDLDPLSGATNHNGGAMAFGPDGKLYIGVGENATAANAQTLSNHLGKVLRINADGSIPADNPFANGTGPQRRIWAYGLRNPYTITFQPGTGRLFVNDVGQNTYEEINDATVGGRNFGWPIAEGPSSNTALTNPVFSYPHGSGDGSGCAITGGAFYNPTTATYPANLVGKYFYQDLCNNWINYIDVSGSSAVRSSFATGLPSGGLGLSLGVDGNLYYLSRGNSANAGTLYKITFTGETPTAPLITGQPTSLTVGSGQAATFAVTATGTGLSYQWLFNGNAISLATSSSYTIPATTTANAGQYRVVVSGPGGSVTSNVANLVVNTSSQPQAFQLVAPLYNCQTGAITFQTIGGNGSSIEFQAIGITGWTTNPNQVIEAGLRADPKPVQLLARQSNITVTYLFNLPGACNGPNQAPTFVGPLSNQLVQGGNAVSIAIPAGAFVDPEGQSLVLSATGLPTGLSLSGNTIVGSTTQLGSFPITIKATDPGGLAASGIFTLTVQTTVPVEPLRLVAPSYNCQTGAIVFQTSGGNGTAIEYFAIGITPWSSNPSQVIEAGLRADPKPVTLFARQNGIEVSYVFNLQTACTPARLATSEFTGTFTARIYPNPVGQELTVGIEGAQGQRVRLQLTDLSGKPLAEQAVDVVENDQRAKLNIVRQPSGVYLLRVSSDRHAVTLRVLKQ